MRGMVDTALRGAAGVLPRLPGPVRRSRVPRDLATVTRVRPDAEVPAARVGMPADAPERIWTAVERVYRTGIHPAIALCLRRDGEVVLDRTIGHAVGNGPPSDLRTGASLRGRTGDAGRGDPAVVCTPDHPFVLASASKAITAMVVHVLDDHGLLHVDDRVCEYIPEFAAHGKQAITIGHVLAHRAGVPNLPSDALDLDLLGDEQHLLSAAQRGTTDHAAGTVGCLPRRQRRLHPRRGRPARHRHRHRPGPGGTSCSTRWGSPAWGTASRPTGSTRSCATT